MISRLRNELNDRVHDYADATDFRASNQKEEVESRLALKNTEVETANETVAAAKAALDELDAQSKDDGALTDLRDRSREIEEARNVLVQRRAANDQQQARLRQQLTNMEALADRAEALRTDAAELNREAEALLGASDTPFINFVVDGARNSTWRATTLAALTELGIEREVIDSEVAEQDEARRENTEALAAADSARERARQRLLRSEERVAALIGDDNDEESQAGLKALLERIAAIPVRVDELRQDILASSKRVYEALQAQLLAVESLYAPASAFIAESDVVKNAGLEFNAELRLFLPGEASRRAWTGGGMATSPTGSPLYPSASKERAGATCSATVRGVATPGARTRGT